MPTFVIYTCAVMLFIGAAPLPYGYYTLLRIVACVVFTVAAITAFKRKFKTLPWVYGLFAILFNPIIKVFLPKEVWAIVDVGAGVLLFVTAKFVRADAEPSS